MRIMEALTRKWTDLEIREQGYARVKLKAADTKARYARYSFITKETIELLNAYRVYGGLKSDYLFPTSGNLHKDYNTAHEAIKPLFAKVGLYDAKDRSEVYTIHSFRTFASDRLRECGMTDKSAKAIIGHRDGSESSYIDWNNVEKEFREKCAEHLCFLSDNSKVQGLQEKTARLEKHNGNLEKLLERVLERLEKDR